MKVPALRLATGLAGAFGYWPAPPDCVRRLQELRGEFHRSRSEILVRLIFAAITVAGCAFFAGAAYRELFIASSARSTLVPGFLSLLFGSLTFIPLSTLSRRYVFSSGCLSAFGWRNRLLWREDLRELQTVVCTNARGTIWMKFIWPDRKRSVELLDTLADAIALTRPAQRRR